MVTTTANPDDAGVDAAVDSTTPPSTGSTAQGGAPDASRDAKQASTRKPGAGTARQVFDKLLKPLADKTETARPGAWVVALLSAVFLGILVERACLASPAFFSTTTSAAKTSILGIAIWGLTTAEEKSLSKWLVISLSRPIGAALLLLLAVLSLGWRVLWIRCDEQGEIMTVGRSGSALCRQGGTIVLSKFGFRADVKLQDSTGLQAGRALLPLEPNTLTYPSDFRRPFYVLIALDAKSVKQVPKSEYNPEISAEPCRSRFCVRLNNKLYGLSAGGLLLGASSADEALLGLRALPANKQGSQLDPLALPAIEVAPNRKLKVELLRTDDGVQHTCGWFEFTPERGIQLWSINSRKCG